MKFFRTMSICSLLLTSAASHAMQLSDFIDKNESAEKAQWEAKNPGLIYNGCSPLRPELKPGYVRDADGRVVLASTIVKNATHNASKDDCRK